MVAPVRNHAGEVYRIISVSRDITERMETQRALKASEAKLHLGVDVAGLALAELNFTSGTVHLTPAAARMYGFGESAVTVPRELFHSKCHPDDRKRLETNIAAAMDPYGKGWIGVDHRISFSGGAVRWLRVRAQVTCEDVGSERRPVRAMIVAMDITSEKHLEMELRGNEQRFRQLADSMPQLVWSARPDGFWDLHNQRWVEYTGLSLEDSKGTGWTIVVHPDDLQILHEKWILSLKTGQSYEVESRYRRHDGEYRWFLIRAVPVKAADGRIVRWFGTSTDIEENRRLGAALQLANDDLKHFVFSASHDLRSPLRTITIFSQLIQRNDTQLDENARKLLVGIEQTSIGMSDLLSNLLTYAEASESMNLTVAAPVDCQQVFERASAALAGVMKECNASITYDPLPVVWMSATHLDQVFQNLLGNALKYRKDDEPAQVNIAVLREDRHWRFSIRDNGIGIKREYQDQVFKLFTRLHASEGKYKGTGLGLAICRRIVEKYGGRIWVESEPGQGSTFHFKLPAEEMARGAASGR